MCSRFVVLMFSRIRVQCAVLALVVLLNAATLCQSISSPTKEIRELYLKECKVYDEYGSSLPSDWDNRTTIEILSFLPCVIGFEADSSQCDYLEHLPILSLVGDEINAKPDILPGYKLKFAIVNSGCSLAVGRQKFYSDVADTLSGQSSVKPMILGPACSGPTEPVAGLGRYLNMNQISYTASGPQFGSRRDIYPRMYTVQPYITLYNDAYIYLFNQFNWKRIALIHEIDPLFTEAAKDLQTKCLQNGIDVAFFGNFDSKPNFDNNPVLDDIVKADLRIVVALFNPFGKLLPRTIWCQARKRGLTNGAHVWFTPIWAPLNLKFDNNTVGGCTDTEVAEAVEYSFGTLGSDNRTDKDSLLVSGKTAQQNLDERACYRSVQEQWYTSRGLRPPEDAVVLRKGYIYDTAWAIALILHQTMLDLQNETNGRKRLEDFDYYDSDMANMMQLNLHKLNFSGASGQVRFDGQPGNATGNRGEHYIQVLQYNKKGKTELIALYSANSDNSGQTLTFLLGREFRWKSGTIPEDGAELVVHNYELWAVLVACLTSGIGAILSIVCLSFTIYFRKERVFKRATPRLNVVICTGTFIGFFSSFLYSLVLFFYREIDNPMLMEAFCNIVSWLTYISFALSFGSLVMKTWRLYRIFYNPAIRKRKYLEDKYLLLGVLGMVILVVIILIPWTATAATEWCEREELSDNRIKRDKFSYCCSKQGDLAYVWYIFLGLWSALAIVLLLFGSFMAFQIKRNLGSMLHKYTETPLINISSLLALLFSSVFMLLHWILAVDAVTLSFLILLVALRDGFWMYPMLLILYIPMAYELIQDKRGLRRRMSTSASIISQVEPWNSRRRESSYSSSNGSSYDRRGSIISQEKIPLGTISKPIAALPSVEEVLELKTADNDSIIDEGEDGSTPSIVQVNSMVDEVFQPSNPMRRTASPLPSDLDCHRRPSILKSGLGSGLLSVDWKERDRKVQFTD